MAYELGVALIHGIGRQTSDFADGLIEELKHRLGAERAAAVCWQPIWWADVVEPKESDLLERLASGGNLDWKWLRSLVIHFLADAVAYQRVPGENAESGVYLQIHRRVAECLVQLHAKLRAARPQGADDPPLLVIAHSLGGHIMSNYFWDHQHPTAIRGQLGETPFVCGQTLAALATFGCNIPLFALALPEVVPIDIPARDLTPALKSGARWLNLYDADDVLAYPLAPLGGYANLVDDRQIKVGGPLTAWNPLSHNAYWTDNDVTRPIAQLIEKLLEPR